MSKLSKIVALLAVGSGAMLVSGAGMAAGAAIGAGAGGFTIDNATNRAAVIAGTLDPGTTCLSGSTCTDLPGTSPGIVMRTVDDGVGNSFIQTIIAEDNAVPLEGLFANEQIARQGVQGDGTASNIAQKMILDDHGDFTADHTMLGADYASPLTGTGSPFYVLNQTINDTGQGVVIKARIQGDINSGGGNVGDAGNNRKVYLDQYATDLVANPEFGEFRYRWGNTVTGAINEDLYQGTGGAAVSSGIIGTNIAALFIHQAVQGPNPTPDNFGLLKFVSGASTTANMTTLGSNDADARLEMDLSAPNVSLAAADSANGYGLFEATSTVPNTTDVGAPGDPAYVIFGLIDDTTDFNTTSFLP